MKNLSGLTLSFAFFSVVFFLSLIFLRIPFPLYPLMSYQDVIDVLTSLVLLPLYWQLYKNVSDGTGTPVGDIAFMVLAGVWAAGQGMHLSANSIDNLIGNLAQSRVIDITGSDIFSLTYFYDEHLSHYLWHIGVVGLAALLIYESWHRTAATPTDWRIVIPAGMLYGFLFFCIFLEGNTMPLGLPFIGAAMVSILIWRRKGLAKRPVLAFFFASCLTAILLFAAWGLYWGCFPPIMEPYHC